MCLMFLILATTTVFANESVKITEIQGRANGWVNNPNWVGFELNKDLDLSEDGTDIVLTYEYVENGKLRQLRRETVAPIGTLYMKNKLWSGYLNGLPSGTKYSGVSSDTNLIPENTTIASNLANMTTPYPALTQKVKDGDIEYFRVRVTIYENGKVADDKSTNWIKYNSDLTTPASLNGISAIDTDYIDVYKDLPELKDMAPVATTEQITVNGVDYLSLEAAIYAANAGDIIEIPTGVYEIYTQIVIDKELTISGAGKDATILKYIDTYGSPTSVPSAYAGKNPIIHATANLTLSNLAIGAPITTHQGIDGIYTTANLHLTEVRISDIRSEMDGNEYTGDQFGRAIVADGGALVTIKNSVFEKFQKTAIDAKNVANLTVTDTIITGAGAQGIIAQNGIVMRDETKAEIKDNQISELEYISTDVYNGGSVAIYLLNDKTEALVEGNTISGVDTAFYGTEESTLALGENTIDATNVFMGDIAPVYLATAVKISDEALALNVSETKTLTAIFDPVNTTNKMVNWTSSTPAVATVDNGVVKAIAPGNAVITVKSVDGALTDTCKVTVTAPIASVKISPKTLTLKVDESSTLSVEMLPANASNKTITWTSSTPAIATINNGVIKAIAPGKAVITVTTADGALTDTCEVTVTAPVASVKISSKTLALKVNESSTLKATILPANTSNNTITWASSVPAIATIDNGVVKAIAPGKTVITATTADGALTDTCTVTVTFSDVTAFKAKQVKKTVNNKIQRQTKLTWKSVANATGYQISLEKINKSNVIVGTRRIIPRGKAKNLSYTTGNLKKGNYRYKIRAYREINGKRYFGAYTKYRKIKIK